MTPQSSLASQYENTVLPPPMRGGQFMQPTLSTGPTQTGGFSALFRMLMPHIERLRRMQMIGPRTSADVPPQQG